MDFCGEVNEGLHRRRLFNYRLVVANIHEKSESEESVLELVNQQKIDFPILLVNFINSGWRYENRDIIEELEMDAEGLARRLSELGFTRRQTS